MKSSEGQLRSHQRKGAEVIICFWPAHGRLALEAMQNDGTARAPCVT